MIQYKPLYYNKNLKFLLLGNGVNRAFNNGKSWEDYCGDYGSDVPLNLRVSLRNLSDKTNNFSNIFANIKPSNEYITYVKKLIKFGFTHFITTNFSYELEYSLLEEKNRNLNYIDNHTFKMTKSEVSKSYSPNTFIEIPFEGKLIRIWHIHGECRKVRSLVYSLESYNKVFNLIKEIKIIDKFYKCENFGYSFDGITYKTWGDFLYINDVYCLGYGFNYCEFDIWSILVDRKKQKKIFNNIFIYSKSDKCFDNDKVDVLKKLDIDVHLSNDIDYKVFYNNLLNILGGK